MALAQTLGVCWFVTILDRTQRSGAILTHVDLLGVSQSRGRSYRRPAHLVMNLETGHPAYRRLRKSKETSIKSKFPLRTW